MAKVKITGHASGTGVFTVTAPNSNTDRTITLPDADVTLGTDATKLPLAGGTMTGDLNFGDSIDANFGASTDLKIYHDGDDSYIDESGTGLLILRSNRIRMKKYTGEDMIDSAADGSVKIFHDNSKKFETSANGVTVTGAVAGATNLVTQVASGSTDAMNTNNAFNIHTVSGTHTSYLVTASANSSITNVMALVSIGTSTSTMRITTLSGSYNTTVTGSGTAIQITCAYGSNLVYQYRVLQLR
jgi:hypothetical protein